MFIHSSSLHLSQDQYWHHIWWTRATHGPQPGKIAGPVLHMPPEGTQQSQLPSKVQGHVRQMLGETSDAERTELVQVKEEKKEDVQGFQQPQQ